MGKSFFWDISSLFKVLDKNLINHFIFFYWSSQPQTSVLKVLSKFLKEHKIDLEGALRQQDKDHSGNLQHEEVKLAFKEAGLRLTNVRLCLNTILLLVYFMNISSDLRIFFYNDFAEADWYIGGRNRRHTFRLYKMGVSLNLIILCQIFYKINHPKKANWYSFQSNNSQHINKEHISRLNIKFTLYILF